MEEEKQKIKGEGGEEEGEDVHTFCSLCGPSCPSSTLFLYISPFSFHVVFQTTQPLFGGVPTHLFPNFVDIMLFTRYIFKLTDPKLWFDIGVRETGYKYLQLQKPLSMVKKILLLIMKAIMNDFLDCISGSFLHNTQLLTCHQAKCLQQRDLRSQNMSGHHTGHLCFC